MRHGLSQPSALPCISRPSSFLGSISTPAPPAPYPRPAIPCVCLGRVPHAHSPHTACTRTVQVACLLAAAATATHAPAPRVDRGHALLCPRVGSERARTLPLATCPSQSVGQRPRRQSQVGPQSGRPPRPLPPAPLPVALASPPAAASSCMYLSQAAAVRYYWIASKGYRRGRGVPISYSLALLVADHSMCDMWVTGVVAVC
jgi:hypothetical protein